MNKLNHGNRLDGIFDLAKLNNFQIWKIGSQLKPKTIKKRKTSNKKKKVSKSGISEGSNTLKFVKKGQSSECTSEASSLKRKQKNMSSSPRNNNIEDLMQQFLVMKNQNNQNDLVQKYGKGTFTAPGFSKEQTDSILNISSHGGTNMSFINCNARLNESRPKSKELKQAEKAPLEYSPKYPLKKGITHIKNYEKRLISGNVKNRKAAKVINGLNSRLATSKDNIVHPKAGGGYNFTNKKWHKDKVVDK